MVRVFIPLIILVLASGCSDSSYPPTLTTYFELKQTIGGRFDENIFLPRVGKVGPGGLIYSLGYYGSEIRTYTLDGVLVDSWDGGERLDYPRSLDLDSNGLVYVLDGSSWVKVFSAGGEYIRGWQVSSDWLPAMAVGGGDQVYVLDRDQKLVMKFSNTGTLLGSWSIGTEFGIPRGVAVSNSGNPLMIFQYIIVEYSPDGEFQKRYDPLGSSIQDVVSSADGSLFVTHGKWKISRLSPQGIPVATWGEDPNGDPYLSYGASITMDASGVLYVLDNNTGRVSKFSQAGELVGDWSTLPPPGGKFWRLKSLTWDSQGFVYALDSGMSRVLKFTPNGEFLSAWGERGHREGMWMSGLDLAVDGTGNVFVLEPDRVQKFTSTGDFLLEWSSNGSQRLEVDDVGNTYVTGAARVRKYSPDGALLAEWTGFVRPHGIDRDSEDVFHVVDRTAHEVRGFTSDGEEVLRWTLAGEPGSLGEPDITVDSDGNTFISSSQLRLIRVFRFGEYFATLMGPRGNDWGPVSIRVDASNSLWVCETWRNEILVYSRLPGSEFD